MILIITFLEVTLMKLFEKYLFSEIYLVQRSAFMTCQIFAMELFIENR